MDVTARLALSDDLDAVTVALVESFFDDPWMTWAFDASVRRQRLEAVWRFMAGLGYVPVGASTVLPEGDGAALWMPPGRELDDEFWAENLGTFYAAMDGDVERIGAFAAAQAEHHPSDDHWYLLAIGIRPIAQGRGLGSVLLAHTLALADEQGAPAYLEATSTRSRALYSRFGFEVISEFNALDSPPAWGMWREPRTARS